MRNNMGHKKYIEYICQPLVKVSQKKEILQSIGMKDSLSSTEKKYFHQIIMDISGSGTFGCTQISMSSTFNRKQRRLLCFVFVSIFVYLLKP